MDQSKQREKMYIVKRLNKTHEKSNPDNRDTFLEKWIPLTTAHEISPHPAYQGDGLNHENFWAHLKILGTSSRTVIATYVLQNCHNFRRLSLNVKRFQHRFACSTQLERCSRQKDTGRQNSEQEDKANHLRPPTLTILHQIGMLHILQIRICSIRAKNYFNMMSQNAFFQQRFL